jgi:hypothetical protein
MEPEHMAAKTSTSHHAVKPPGAHRIGDVTAFLAMANYCITTGIQCIPHARISSPASALADE